MRPLSVAAHARLFCISLYRIYYERKNEFCQPETPPTTKIRRLNRRIFSVFVCRKRKLCAYFLRFFAAQFAAELLKQIGTGGGYHEHDYEQTDDDLVERGGKPDGHHAHLQNLCHNGTCKDLDWNAPENQVNFDVREYPQMYREGLKNQGKVPEYIGRPPKKFPEKDLHGRLRFGTMYYKDFRRWQKFWVDLFGWDMIELPGSAGGKTEGAENPNVIIATGPSYYDYEALVPGHMNLMAMYTEQETVPDIDFIIEIHMTESPRFTVDKIVALGGKLLGEIPETDNWASMFPVSDPFGNVYKLWKCPDTRTWTDPESGWKGMSEEHIDKLSLFWPKKDF